MSVRCVVTGHNARGDAVVVSDTVNHGTPFTVFDPFVFVKLWSGDKVPSFPNGGSQPGGDAFFPPIGGVRFFSMTVPPVSEKRLTPEERRLGFEEMESLVPGLAPHMEWNNPGQHTTDSIDFGYVADGEIWLELDGSAQTKLSAGDTFVQSATRHAWRNKSKKPCTMIFVTVGAHREPKGISLVGREADRRP